METKLQIIETEEYTLAVSEKEIKHGEELIPNEWYINSYRGYDKPFKNHNLDSNGYLKRVFAYQPKNNALELKYEVECNNCNWQGYEEDLEIFPDLSDNNNISHDIQYFKGCPNCRTDGYLKNLEKSINKLELPLLPEMVVEDNVELELKDFKSSNVLDILNMGNINYLSNGDIVYNPDLLFIKRNDRWFSKHKSATKIYSQKDMEKCFIAGGKSARNINNQGFDEFIKSLKQPKWFVAETEYDCCNRYQNCKGCDATAEMINLRLKTTSKNGKTYLVGTYLYE